MTSIENVTPKFNEWLLRQTGNCKWIVARRSKKRVEAGYDLFMTQKKFSALQRFFDKETAEMDDLSLHLTEPNQDLAKKRKDTRPGMAFWAATGPASRTCRECRHWDSLGYLASSGLLRDSPCARYRSMMNGETGPGVPHYAKACKYFDVAAEVRAVHKPK